jgi:glycosyltransferase involved in cell wall biosynthesis
MTRAFLVAQPRFHLDSSSPGAAGSIILDQLANLKDGQFRAVSLTRKNPSQGKVIWIRENSILWRLLWRVMRTTSLGKSLGRRQTLMLFGVFLWALWIRPKYLIVHTTKMAFADAIARLCRWCDVIVYHHTAEDQNRPEWQVRSAVTHCRGHIFVSQYALSQFESGVKTLGCQLKNAYVIRNRVDCRRFRPDKEARLRTRTALGVAEDVIVVLFSGRLIRRKGLDVLVEAYGLLDKDLRKNICVVVAGAGDYGENGNLGEFESYRPKWRDLVVQKQLVLCGYVEPSRMPRIMVSADILAFPILMPEACGLVVLEAQACGVPVIVSNIGGTTEYFCDGVTGIGVSPGSARELAVAIEWLAREREVRERMGAAARKYVLRFHEAGSYGGELEGALKKFEQTEGM